MNAKQKKELINNLTETSALLGMSGAIMEEINLFLLPIL